MTKYFAFNGDADGLCALQQLRLSEPGQCVLVTGVKRDIVLLDRVPAESADECIVLDVSLDKNRVPLQALLERGCRVRYFDHHFAGEVPEHQNFEAHLDPAPDACTSLLVDRSLGGTHRRWAIVGAFGDNLGAVATALAGQCGLGQAETLTLKALGECLNYNAYGETVADLHLAPDSLAAEMLPYSDPLSFARSAPAFAQLAQGFADDMAHVQNLASSARTPNTLLFQLPPEAWSRRVSGTLGNQLRTAHPGSAIAIISKKSQGGLLVSLRVPAAATLGADDFCRRYDTGGGRRTAAGINHLPESDLPAFVEAFQEQFELALAE